MNLDTFARGPATLFHGDCRDVLAELPEGSVDAIVTDPPYHLTAQSRVGSPRVNDPATPYGRTRIGARGFMGTTWDGGDLAHRPELWAKVLRLAKPGAHLVAFGGSRTFHRLACALEDAGWEIRDCLAWLYGTGFPKSYAIEDAIAQLRGPTSPEAAQWAGFGTALKPAWEPIVLARAPMAGTVAANVLEHGTGGLDIDACRIGTERPLMAATTVGRERVFLRIEGRAKIGMQPGGRWPANVVLDPEAAAALDAQTGELESGGDTVRRRDGWFGTGSLRHGGLGQAGDPQVFYGDRGGASRFFYCPKVRRDEQNDHPTVKPVDLLRWLVRLVARPGALVLDPFAGSGTTGVAALEEGRKFVGVELEPDYFAIASGRLADTLERGRQGELFEEQQ